MTYTGSDIYHVRNYEGNQYVRPDSAPGYDGERSSSPTQSTTGSESRPGLGMVPFEKIYEVRDAAETNGRL